MINHNQHKKPFKKFGQTELIRINPDGKFRLSKDKIVDALRGSKQESKK